MTTFNITYAQIAPNSTGQEIDGALVNNGVNNVMRQIINIGDPANYANVAQVGNAGLQTMVGSLDGVTNTADNPTYQVMVGDPGGDFAGVNILDELVGGGLSMNTTPGNPGQKKANASDSVVIALDQANDLIVTGQASTLNGIVFSIDTVTGYPVSYHSFYCEVDIPSTWTAGNFIFEGSNSGIGTWNPLTVYDDALITAAVINSQITPAANTQRFFSGKATYRFIRLRLITPWSGAFCQAICRFSTLDYIPRVMAVGQVTAGNLNSNVSGSISLTSGTVTTVSNITAGTVTLAPNITSIGMTNLVVNAGGALAAVKASAGNLYGFSLVNNNAAVAYLEFWNIASGSVTLGTTAPIAVYMIPASSTLTVTSNLSLMYSGTALSYACVTSYNGTTPGSITGTILYA